MSSGTVHLTLRPIKLAFLVEPGDRAGLLEAIRINTCLWGGVFNPIVPNYSRLPKQWEPHHPIGSSAKEVIAGYIDAYDPDFLVTVGKPKSGVADMGNRKVIHSSEILQPIKDDGTVAYGIGLFEVLRRFYHEELRFERRDPLEIAVFELSAEFPEFLASVFGDLPYELAKIFTDHFVEPLRATKHTVSLQNYVDFLVRGKLFLRRFTTFYIKPHQNRFFKGECLFFLDASKMIDVIDYWNLRAVGWNVIPIAKQVAYMGTVKKLAEDFIEENFVPYRSNPQMYRSTTLLKSRSVTDTDLDTFMKSLNIKPTPSPHAFKLSLQLWYPRIWDAWARDKDDVQCCDLESDSRQKDVSDQADRISLETLDPKFVAQFGGGGEPRFANEIGVRIYGHKNLLAEALPEGDSQLARAFQIIGTDDWRLSQKGLVYLSEHLNWNIHFSPAMAEDVFARWFETKGWKTEVSSPGRLAYQMLKQLGGTWGISTLANEELIKLLGDMSDGKPLKKGAFWGRIRRVANAEQFVKDPKHILKRLTDAQVFQIGHLVQCPVCQQHSWYSVTEAGYQLQCPKCLEKFPLPSHSPDEIQWAYRTFGPFSLPGQCYGTYAVLLTLRFFSQLIDAATTPMLSFKAKRGGIDMEIDLSLLFKESRFGSSSKTEVAFCECKTFDIFEKRDVDRMSLLAENFPGAFLVFATLRRNLEPKEKRLIARIAKRGRKYWKEERPYNAVLILTGNELFADWRPESAWRDLGGKHAALADATLGTGFVGLADATQQLYLDLQPWHQWLRSEWERKRSNLSVTPPGNAPQTAP